MNFQQQGYTGVKETKCISIIKFKDNVKFSIDGDSIRDELLARYNSSEEINALKCKGTVIEMGSGATQVHNFILSLRGLFRQSIEGQIWLPQDVSAKFFEYYVKGKPYILIFKYEDLERFEFRKVQ